MTGPSSVAGFRIERELGHGGMGIVFLAHDPVLDRLVAIKSLPPLFTRNQERLESLLAEARALARVNHPNVAQIYSFEECADGSYLVMEYVPGENLSDRLSKIALSLDEAIAICAQIASGLSAAHKKGVIHRDVKPANVRITEQGQVKVVDFGLALARLQVPAPSSTSWMISDQGDRIAGTPSYMSPEQLRGGGLDRRSDIFAFGCILYECLTGSIAFFGSNLQETAERVLFDDPDWTLLPPNTPPRIDRLLRRCLDKDRARRTPHLDVAVGELSADDYESTQDHESLLPPHNLPEEVSSFVGHEETINRLQGTIDMSRLVTLTGAGGCGKTRLAVKLARNSLSLFTDGVWFVSLATLSDPTSVTPLVSRTVGEIEPTSSLDRLCVQLRRKRALLVLDNCEHLLAVVRPLVDTLLRSCSSLRILATSRQLLGLIGEAVFLVPSLTVPGENEEPEGPEEVMQYESVRLLVDRGKSVRNSFRVTSENMDCVTSICRRLDGIPLAVELAAARLGVLSIREIADRLDKRFQLLTGGSEVALDRHRTLQATLDWSFELLTPDEKRMFLGLSIFADGWYLPAAVHVCGNQINEFQVFELLGRLVEKSLIFRVEPRDGSDEQSTRFRMHESARAYAMDRLSEGDHPSTAFRHVGLRDRHFEYYLGLAERTSIDAASLTSSQWRHAMEIDRKNLMEALRWSLQTHDGTSYDLRLARAMRVFDKGADLSQLDRNGPCPCSSGKRFKRCCGQ